LPALSPSSLLSARAQAQLAEATTAAAALTTRLEASDAELKEARAHATLAPQNPTRAARMHPSCGLEGARALCAVLRDALRRTLMRYRVLRALLQARAALERANEAAAKAASDMVILKGKTDNYLKESSAAHRVRARCGCP
jgi:hypothetical protein